MPQTSTAPFIEIPLTVIDGDPHVVPAGSAGDGYTVDELANIARQRHIPVGEAGRVTFQLQETPGKQASFLGLALAENMEQLDDNPRKLDTGGKFYMNTPFQISYEPAASPRLNLFEGPYADQLIPLEGWYYKIFVEVDGEEHALDPRIYNKGDGGGGV